MAERGLRALRVLVIDDSREMCSIVGTVLAAAGVGRIHYARDGRAALEAMRSFDPDVAYVDEEMPGMSGLEFVSAVRAMDSNACYLPIIMLTGHADLKHLYEARDRGVTEFLCKPVSANAILTHLNEVITAPRPFFRSATYFGPDRRRTGVEQYHGPRRRASDGQGGAR
jgi:two-component system, chemotaxis family, chemotaxis protein CheY